MELLMYNIILKKLNSVLDVAYNDYIKANNLYSKHLSETFAKAEILTKFVPELLWTLLLPFKKYEKQNLFNANADFLKEKFAYVIKNIDQNNNKISYYFVSDDDHNGFLLGSLATYNHLYEIKNLQEHGYTVYPYVSNSLTDINDKLSQSKEKVDLLYLSAHGSNEALFFGQECELDMPDSYYKKFGKGVVSFAEDSCRFSQIFTGYDVNFANLANNASIILNACSTAEKDKDSLAYAIALQNPNVNVFAAKEMNFVLDINFVQDEHNDSIIKSIDYQPAYTCGWPMLNAEQMTVFKSGEVMQESLEVC
jgi:hypothetical protein